MKVRFAFCVASDVVCPEEGLSHPRIRTVFFFSDFSNCGPPLDVIDS